MYACHNNTPSCTFKICKYFLETKSVVDILQALLLLFYYFYYLVNDPRGALFLSCTEFYDLTM